MTHRIACLIALAALLPACGGSQNQRESAAGTPTATPVIEKVTGDPTPLPEITPSGKDEPNITVPKGDPPGKLVIRDIERGDGAEAAAGKTLAVDYKGVRFDDGKPFDSSWSTGTPFQFVLGARQAIQGWTKAWKACAWAAGAS